MTRKQKKELLRILVAALLLVVCWCLPLDGWWALLYLIPYAVAGWDVLWSAARNIAHGQLFDEQFLMAIATIGALCVGEYREAVAVMIFYQVGEWFQRIAVGKSRKSISSLMDIRPDTATVVRDGAELEVSPEDVQTGETIVVKPGERVPLDGVILTGDTSVNAAALTGESAPVDKRAGDEILSGVINLTGVITVRTTGTFAESTVARILELVENASSRKSKAENFITRFARVYTPCVVAGAVLLAFVPPLFFHQNLTDWVMRALNFLVVSCPCALVVSVPLSFFGGLGGASREGILLKGSNCMEALAHVKTCVFDKTGTLTRGAFRVTKAHPVGVSEDELLTLAALAESNSSHPIAQSILAAYGRPVEAGRISSVTELAGHGVEAVIDGAKVYAGNARMMEEVACVEFLTPEEAGTVVHVAANGKYLGYLVIEDEIKPDAKEALQALKALGVQKNVLLTGDNARVGEAVARRLGMDEVHAGLLPADKVSSMEALLTQGGPVMFVGDGINDAPVIARADLGVAMGGVGSDAAIEAADIVLMDDKLSKLPRAIEIARRTMRIVRENIGFSLAVKALILILSAVGAANMWHAVFADVGVLVLATLNAMRALKA